VVGGEVVADDGGEDDPRDARLARRDAGEELKLLAIEAAPRSTATEVSSVKRRSCASPLASS
jgi:hypothetical protein